MNKNLRVAVLTGASALGGCAGWSHPSKSEAEFHQDRFQCEQSAASMYPVNMVSGPTYQAPTRTNCSGYGAQMQCTTMPGYAMPAAQSDSNSLSRNLAVNSCLQGKGYQFKFGS